jgi:hypothetical protein
MVAAEPIQESPPPGTPWRVIKGSKPSVVGFRKATPTAVKKMDSPRSHGLKGYVHMNAATDRVGRLADQRHAWILVGWLELEVSPCSRRWSRLRA